jgi:UDP-N-acetylmuramoyl-tripeptide--D-alanyl-D-alanine ligase
MTMNAPIETTEADALLWTMEAVSSAMAAEVVGDASCGFRGISIDTRTLNRGDLFFAIRGEAQDGHDYVAAALAKGAAAAVVAADRASDFTGTGPLFVVPDVLQGLVQLGLAARARSTARIVAVTGSVGKTGTKEALRTVLAGQGAVHASAASYNNHFGVPLTLARMPADSAFGVFEIGMNHAGEITPLTGMVRPHVALITTVEPVHLENLGSIEAIADAKGEIFSGLEPGGTAILNRDNGQYERLLGLAEASRVGQVMTFGEHPDADVRLVRLVSKPDLSIVEAYVQGVHVSYRLGSPGKHVAMNSLGVLASVVALGADLTLACLKMADVKPPSGRGQQIRLAAPGGEITLFDESYNANPASMRAALEVLGQAPVGLRGRRIAVLGDMLELGPDAPKLHAGLASALESNGIDVVFAAGPLMKSLWQSIPLSIRGAYAATAAELEPAVIAALRAGDVVTVKGSNGSRTGRIVAALKARYAPPPHAID